MAQSLVAAGGLTEEVLARAKASLLQDADELEKRANCIEATVAVVLRAARDMRGNAAAIRSAARALGGPAAAPR